MIALAVKEKDNFETVTVKAKEVRKDKDGNRVKSSTLDVNCTIEGPAVLLGLEGSNNSDMSDYRDNHQPVFRGRLVAYVKRTGIGDVKVTFSGEGVKPATFSLQ